MLEAYTSTAATPITDALALDGLAAVRAGLLVWHADPDGETARTARSEMAYAALLSGICLANAGLGAVHGLAAPIGSLLPIAHGAACGAILATTVRTNIRAMRARTPEAPGLARYATAGRLLGGLGAATDDDVARGALIDTLGMWTQRLGAPRPRDLGLASDDAARVVAGVSGNSMRTNPVSLTDAELRTILLD